MRTCLTLAATAIFSSLAAAAPMTANVDGNLTSRVVSPQIGSMRDVDSDSALFKREEDVMLYQAQLTRKIRNVFQHEMSLLMETFDYESWEDSRAYYELNLAQIEAQVEDVKDLSGGNFDVETELSSLRNMQKAMTGIAEKIHDLGERNFAGKDLVKKMMLLSVEVFALSDVRGHVDTSNPRILRKYDEIKSRVASLMEDAEDEFLMTRESRDLFEEYTRRVNYSMSRVARSMETDGQ